MHPIEDLDRFQLKVLKISHKDEASESPVPDHGQPKGQSGSTSIEYHELENGISAPRPCRRSTFREQLTTFTTGGHPDKPKPKIPAQTFSPLNVLSVTSCILTFALFIAAVVIKDGTACLALGTISLASSVVGYASWWSPALQPRHSRSKVPPGDIIIRTREGAFLLVKCKEDVARELYVGTEECIYHVGIQRYRILVGLGTFLLMVSVVLLGNCGFAMQAAIGASYIILNGAFWAASLIPKDKFWYLSLYVVQDITPEDARGAHLKQDDSLDGRPSFTRTLWYAIRETRKIGWVKKSGAAPRTPQWDAWLQLALENSEQDNRLWTAVAKKEDVVGQSDSISQAKVAKEKDTAEQHAPAVEIQLPALR